MEKNLLSKNLTKTFINVLSSLGFGLLFNKYSSNKQSLSTTVFLNKTKYAFFVTLFGVLFGIQNAKSQTVSSYTFAQTTGTYTAITGTTLWTSTDDVVGTITLPFTFMYCGTSYTSCTVNSNGYLVFGTAGSTTIYTPISSGSGSGVVSPFGRDLVTTVIWTTQGAAPNRTVVIQYVGNRYGITETLNFQIRLLDFLFCLLILQIF